MSSTQSTRPLTCAMVTIAIWQWYRGSENRGHSIKHCEREWEWSQSKRRVWVLGMIMNTSQNDAIIVYDAVCRPCSRNASNLPPKPRQITDPPPLVLLPPILCFLVFFFFLFLLFPTSTDSRRVAVNRLIKRWHSTSFSTAALKITTLYASFKLIQII